MASLRTKKKIRSSIVRQAAEWFNETDAWLGNSVGVVESDTPGFLYARLANGNVVEVINNVWAPSLFDLHVKIGENRHNRRQWRIIRVVDDYSTPATGGLLAFHHAQHEEEGADRVSIDRKQIRQLTIRVSATWTVQIYGSLIRMGSAFVKVTSQSLDLSSYTVSAGARFSNIEADETGALSVHNGTNFGSIFIATASNIPIPTGGKIVLGSVLFYEGQTALADTDIWIPFPTDRGGTGSEIFSSSTVTTIADGDLWGFFQIASSLFKSITFANIKAALKTYFDTLYSVLGHSHASSLAIQEADDSPSVSAVSTIKVSNGLLVNNGSGSVSLYHFEPLTNGDPASPAMVFDPATGDLILVAKE